MRQKSLVYREVDYIPEDLEDGVLYVTERYRTAIHKCCCGCGEEVVTPVARTEWRLTVSGGRATLYPSIGNWSFECRSHYWIKGGEVIWAGDMSEQQIQYVRDQDRRLKQKLYSNSRRRDILARFSDFIRDLFRL